MTDYWSRPLPDVLRELEAGEGGLTDAEAALRRERYGANAIASAHGGGVLRLILRQYESPLVLILVFGALVSMVVHEWTDAGIILAIVLGSTFLGFFQEYRASQAVARLREQLALRASLLRDGCVVTRDVREIVPGDIVTLSAGDLVPADGRVLEARDFLVSQAALTGETFPVEKSPAASPADAPLAGRTNVAFLGTSVQSGTARMLVTRTGTATEFGQIAGHVSKAAEASDFQRGIRAFGYLLTRVMLVIVVFVFTINLMLHRPLVDSLLFSVALAVGLSPELLPAIVSITLAAGARRMAERGVIVRRLEAIENLGSIDVLCTDKTGTLTRGVVAFDGAVDPEGGACARTFALAAANARLETGIANPLDAAIIAAAAARNLPPRAGRKIDEIPYDFVRKRLTIVAEAEDGAGHLMITKGAVNTVLDCCTAVAGRCGPEPLDAAARAKLDAFCGARGAQGVRVLGLASRALVARAHYTHADEAEMVFEGFLLFFDPLKDGIVDTVREIGALGVAVKIITGDNRHVAAHVAEAVGLDGTALITGADMHAMSDEALRLQAGRASVFAEADPQQKERVIRALKQSGHAVAYMGDGVNDAPALHTADAGVSVDQAVDVARETADIVLLRQDLDVLRQGIVDGRRTFANTLKYISIATSANFGNMVSMAAATAFVPFLPLLAKQILLNNFLSDLPAVAISTDRVDEEALARPQRWDIHAIGLFMVVFGLVSSLFDFITFAVLLKVFHAGEAEFQSTWFVLSVLTELAVILVLRTRLPAWKSRPSPFLAGMVIAVGLLVVALPHIGWVAELFGFVPLPLPLFLSGVAIVAGYVVATEVTKRVFLARLARGRRQRRGLVLPAVRAFRG